MSRCARAWLRWLLSPFTDLSSSTAAEDPPPPAEEWPPNVYAEAAGQLPADSDGETLPPLLAADSDIESVSSTDTDATQVYNAMAAAARRRGHPQARRRLQPGMRR